MSELLGMTVRRWVEVGKSGGRAKEVSQENDGADQNGSCRITQNGERLDFDLWTHRK